MKPRKKNGFFTFLCSLCPGAAEMYMGFMKNGLSLLVIFIVPIMVAIIMYGGDYLAIISGVIYVFSFFHARNIATAPQEEFDTLEDRYIWEEFSNVRTSIVPTGVVTKWGAAILIIAGISGLWRSLRGVLYGAIYGIGLNDYEANLLDNAFTNLPRFATSILVIVVGVLLVRGKKKEMIGEDEHGTDSDGANE